MLDKGRKDHSKRIVVAEDSKTQAEYLSTILENSGFSTEVVNNGEQALDACLKSPPILLVSDIMMPKMDGYELCRRIKAHENLKHLPVILLSSFADPSDILGALEAGADLFLPKEESESTLIEKVQGLITSCQTSKENLIESARVLLVEDSPVQAERLRHWLVQMGFEVRVSLNGRDALDALARNPVDLIISDVVMPEIDGYSFCRQVKQNKSLRKIPLLLLTSQTEKEAIIKGLEAGADAYMGKSEADDKLLDKISELLESSMMLSGDEEDQKIQFQGKTYDISLPRRRILNFLLTTYEQACLKNKALQHAQLDLKRLNQHLEKRVAERTRELTAANEQLLILKRAIDAADQGVTITDPGLPDNPIIYVNRKFTQLTGYRRDEVLGKNWRFLQGKDTDENEKFTIREAISRKKRFVGELVNYRKDGTPFWNAITITPVFSNDGSLLNFIGMQKDVTEEKRIREENRKKTELMRATNQIFQEALSCEKEGDIARKCLDMAVELSRSQVGFVVEIIQGDQVDIIARRIVTWEHRQVAEDWAQRMLEEMEVRNYWEPIFKDGEPQIVNDPAWDPDSTDLSGSCLAVSCFLGVPLFNAGKVFGMIALANKTSGYDMDDVEAVQNLSIAFVESLMRKRSEIRLKQQHLRLNLLNTITRSIGERLDPESIFSVVLESLETELLINFGCVCLIDFEIEALVISTLGPKSVSLASMLELGPGAEVPIRINGIKRCIEGSTVYEPDTSKKDEPLLRRFSTSGFHSVIAIPLQVENEVLGVLLAARSQTDGFNSIDAAFLRQLGEHVALAVSNARLYEKLHASYDELQKTQKAIMDQERLKAMGQMASGLSHDINNALGPIILYTDSLLESEERLSDEGRRYLTTIQTAATDISNTITRMREFYRKRDELIMRLPVNLNELVEQSIELTQPRWKNMPQERGVVIQAQTTLQKDLKAVAGLETEIRDALTNLIFNAVDAMPEGGFLTISTRQQASMAALEVSDTGTGMDEETMSRCLEPFFTSKGDRGTGLGLPMVYGVMQRLDGKIEIDSKPGKGTTVRLLFPLQDAEAPTNEKDPAKKTPQMTILYIDDDAFMRESMKRILEKDGHKVQIAEGGLEGIDYFNKSISQKSPYDVVITDLGMPFMDGREVARNIKQNSPGTPVVLLTGWGTRIEEEGSLPEHVDRLLCKPTKINELRRVLGEFAIK